MSSFFEKQENGVRISAATWITDKGKPDIPENWNTCRFRMEDGSIHRVRRSKLTDHKWKWIGQDDAVE